MSIKLETILKLDKIIKQTTPEVTKLLQVYQKYKKLDSTNILNLSFEENLNKLKDEHNNLIIAFEVANLELDLKAPNYLFNIDCDVETFKNYFKGSRSKYKRKFYKIKDVLENK